MFELNIRPGLRNGAYPQKAASHQAEWEKALLHFYQRCKSRLRRRLYSRGNILRQINRYRQALLDCSEAELSQAIDELRADLTQQGLQAALILKSFAVIREAAGRTLGKRHYDVQLYGGWIMINGMLAEMETGEGKTLTTSLAACTAALSGIPVHVITANDYLAARDAEIMAPLYHRLGLRSSAVVGATPLEQCRQNYLDNIVHTTNKQIAFDYLRDRIAMGEDTGTLSFQYRQIQRRCQPGGRNQLLLNGLCFALVDETDSVLIDEAKTPLIITKTLPNDLAPNTYGDALYLASTLFVDIDYMVDHKSRKIELTLSGEESLAETAATLPKIWQSKRQREMLVKQALAAEIFFHKDRHYLVEDDSIQIIDESTGRVMADRSWEQGLHQMIEAKEGCVISEQREPQARISYQRFFSRYLHLGGTSGTISEVSPELQAVYGLDVVRVAPNRPCKRLMLPEKIYRDDIDRKVVLINRLRGLRQGGRPVLIGTSSVLESERVSEWLHQFDIPHRVLNAKQDEQEAEIIAAAGQAGAITVATNMAGRGTDIALGPGVADIGGLHVIALNRNDSRRVDRQLYGRCARQGDPGSAEAILSFEDPVLVNYYSPAMLKLLGRMTTTNRHLSVFISRLLLCLPQRKSERVQSRARKMLIKQDRQLRRILAFSGKFE